MHLFVLENNVFMIILWLVIFIVTLGIELSTAQLVSIWFSGGAVISLILAFFNVSWEIQLIVFALSSLLLLVVTQPFIKKKFKDVHLKTNVNSLVGSSIVILKDVSITNQGEGKIRDIVWTCKTEDETPILKGEIAIVLAVNGNSLIVTKKGN